MNYYLIYQLFIDKFYKENSLVVSKQLAKNDEDAKYQHLEEIHPQDKEQQKFIEGYLSVDCVSKKQFDSISQDDIDDNRKFIGRWL